MAESAAFDPGTSSPLGRYAQPSDESAPLVEVVLLGVPVELYHLTRQQNYDLLREATLLTLSHGGVDGTDTGEAEPAEFRHLISELGAHSLPGPTVTDEQVEVAAAGGASSVDLSYHVPASVVADADALESLMDRADQFCAQGRMLTMPRTPRMKALTRWWLGEIRRQVAGASPTPWQER